MTRHARVVLQTMLCCAVALAVAPAAQAAFGVAKFEAGTCTGSKEAVKKCRYTSPAEAFYTQAAGHPPWGLTGFEMNSEGGVPSGPPVKNIRVDVPPGLAADPVTLGTCPRATFESSPKTCPAGSEAGFVELTAYVELPFPLPPQTLTLEGRVYNLPEEPGLPLLFGIDVEGAPPLVNDVHLFLEGHVSYAFEAGPAARGVPTGDYHEWFTIQNIPPEVAVEALGIPLANAPLKTLESKLFFNGHAGEGGRENFLTLPSDCATSPTSYLEVESAKGERANTPTVPPVGIEKCNSSIPFQPRAVVTPETSQYDTPDGVTTEVKVPQNEGGNEINTADIRDAKVVLPEGLTLNPSAAHGLTACTPTQLGKGTTSSFGCPASSKIGTVTIETDLPPKSLTGNVYLGKPNGASLITKPPYLIFLDAETELGVKVKLEGEASPNATTGRLEVNFNNNPQLPFSNLILKLNGGSRAPLANSVTCGKASTDSVFTPYTRLAAFSSSAPFTTTGCPSPVPFALSQSTSQSTSKAAAFTSFTFNLSRNDGQQNISSLQTTLPAGLVGLIPSIKRCSAAQAKAGSCPSTSQIGTASASAGVGSEPYAFSGPVYLTEAMNGAPYGLYIPIEASAGPFDLGQVRTYVAISVDPHTARVVASATLPRIVGGVPLHLRKLSVAVTKTNFLFNPTSCSGLTTNSLVSAIQGAGSADSTPFPVTSCTSLPFKPVFTASSPTKPSRASGASLIVSYTQPGGEANIKSVVATLPSQLPSRLTTLHQACPEATFAANPKTCPAGSLVGTAAVGTPVLPEKLTGPAYLVSHGGAAFPNLVLILEGDHGVRVILEGTTNIAKGITTSTFASVPDVPVSSFELNLPTGPHSALGNFGSLCSKPLYLPIGLTAQNGATMKQKVRLSVGSCHIKLLSHRIKKHTLIARVQVFTAGRLSLTGKGLHTVYKKVKGPGIVTIKAPVSIKGRHTLAAGGRLKVRARVGFNPRHKNEFHSAAFTKVTFRH